MREILLCVPLVLLAACGGGSQDEPTPAPKPDPVETKIPVSLSVNLSGDGRATETAFENGDRVGLYMVNYTGSAAGTLASNGNHADNKPYTFSGSSWTTPDQLYWKDATTHADFYCYYPYSTVSDVRNFGFDVRADQSTLAAFKASELLWGKTTDVAPTTSAVGIMVKHLMSAVAITLKPGAGFTTASLAEAQKSVRINDLRVGSTVDLGAGTVTAIGAAASIVPYTDGDTYRAIVVPQRVSSEHLVTVTVNGYDFELPQSVTFESGKRYNISITVNNTPGGINVGISQWDEETIEGVAT